MGASGSSTKSASDRHAPPEETCKLIGKFAQSEIKMIKYVEAHAQQCGILAQFGEQMKTGHRNTENMLKKVCDAAKQPHPAKGLQIANRLDCWKALYFGRLWGIIKSLPEELS